MMPFDTKTMLILGLALGVVAFLIWSKFFNTKKQQYELPPAPPPETAVEEEKVETNKEE